ncbi:squamous cell carcinoma antigen recognized by T-cells 3 [Periplaneta americana]|uniref:squamous cell carcinoma antigen recognized by T-cells 3 n=1 Tax=Periplaneta americana TaxID=6978 RepID=UPI0037E833BD
MSAEDVYESEKMETDKMSDKDKISDKSSDSEDESSDETSDNEEEQDKQATQLEKKIKRNPYEYNTYIELIKLLQKMAEIDRLRKARESMSKHFPLTPELWLSWLKDEMGLATSDIERTAVAELFERAVQDYLSVDLWLEYAQFSIGNMGLQYGVKIVRDTFERALTSVGLHVAKGAILWEAYREFENVMLGMLQAKVNADSNDAQKQELDAQKKRMVAIFRRQLACPLLDMEKTYQEFTEWLNEEPDRRDDVDMKNIENGFKKALLKLSKILPFEEQLLSSDDASRAEHYRAYVQHEISEGDPARVQCLYERAVAELCLDASIWLEYVEYLYSTLKIDTVVLPVCKRAVRNCPWSSPLWQHYMKALERYEKSFDEIKEVMEQALSVGFSNAEDYRNLWLCYIDYMRRRVDWSKGYQPIEVAELRGTFNRACEHLAQYFGLQGDPNCDILQYWARIEAAHCGNMEKFRLLWSDILGQGHEKTAAMWLEYIQWERAFGDNKHLRRLFPRALMCTEDWPESIGNAWLNYERDEGTLDSFEFCMSKYKSRLKQINDLRKRIAEKQAEMIEQDKWRQERRQEKGKKQNPKDTWKKKHETEGKWAAVAPKSTLTKPGSKNIAEVASTPSKQSSVAEPPPGYEKRERTVDTSEEPSAKKSKGEKMETEHGVTVVHDSSKDNRTVFVSNLDYSVTEDRLKEVFSSIGTLTDLRLVKDYKGRSKGFCYVEFSSVAEAETALKRDREPMDGRPMFISKCDSDKHTRQSGFKYSSTLEKNKLFVKGLPLSMTKEELEEIFKPYGSLKDVRIVTYRNGHSKGLAYVEFDDEAAAAHALIKTDGMTFGERTISVAISKPPERKNTPAAVSSSSSSSVSVTSLGGGVKDLGPRGRGRTQVSLLPRALQVSRNTSATNVPAPSSVTSNGSNSSSTTNGDDGGGSGDARKPMSNSDFRQLLLGTKK